MQIKVNIFTTKCIGLLDKAILIFYIAKIPMRYELIYMIKCLIFSFI